MNVDGRQERWAALGMQFLQKLAHCLGEILIHVWLVVGRPESSYTTSYMEGNVSHLLRS